MTLAHGPSPNASDAITVVVSVNDAHGNVVQNGTASLLIEVTAPANGVQPQTTSQVPVANTASRCEPRDPREPLPVAILSAVASATTSAQNR